MDKQQVLAEVGGLASQNLITSEELLEAFYRGRGQKALPVWRKLNAAQLLYYIGGGIVFLGLAIFVGQNWESLNSLTKILATLGAAMAAFAMGAILARNEKYEGSGSAFFVISALLSPLGVFVALDQMGISFQGYGLQSVIAAVHLAIYLSVYFAFYRRSLFLLFCIFFGTWLFFAFTDFAFGNSLLYDFKFIEYRALVTGLVYALLGYALSAGGNRALTGLLYSLGILGFLGAAMALQGWFPRENLFWELIYPFLALGVVLLSARLKSKAFLVLGSLFLMGYILKITGEYFADSVGWPLALVVAGFGLIAVGYFTVYLRKKYLSPAS